MRVALDTNILIFLLRGEPKNSAEKIAETLVEYDGRGQLLISPFVWSELELFLDKEKLRVFLKDNRILVDWELVPEVWSTASLAFRRYLENRRRNGSLYHCATCGGEIQVRCPFCSQVQSFPRHILPDFLIAAHALHQADLFLTADRGIPGKYFPELKVFNPLGL